MTSCAAAVQPQAALLPQGKRGSVEWYSEVGSKRAVACFTLGAIAGAILIAGGAVPIGAVILAVSAVALSILFYASLRRECGGSSHLDTSLYTMTKTAFSVFSCPPKNSAEDQRTPILFLHGMLGNGTNGYWLLHGLKDLGPVYSLNMGTDLKTVRSHGYSTEIRRMAGKVQEFVQERFDATKPFTIVAHSRGGPVAMELAAAGYPVHRIITLGSPLKEAVTEESPEHRKQKATYLYGLTKRVDQLPAVRVLQIGSQADGVVSDDEATAGFKSSERVTSLVYTNLGHTGYLYSDRVLGKVREFIAT